MRRAIPGVIVALSIIFSALAYPALPDRVVTHWNVHGVPDGWSSRAFAAWLMPALMLVIWVVMRLLPRIDPRAESYPRFERTYVSIITVIIAFIAVLHATILGNALGWNISVPRVIPLAVGALLIIIGNLLPRARPNWFVGIRTPWTLSSDRVWERTHRLGGVLFVVGGFVLMASAFAPTSLAGPAMITIVAVAALIPALYSLLLWTREKRGA